MRKLGRPSRMCALVIGIAAGCGDVQRSVCGACRFEVGLRDPMPDRDAGRRPDAQRLVDGRRPDRVVTAAKDQGADGDSATGLGSRCSKTKPCTDKTMGCLLFPGTGSSEGYCTVGCPAADLGKPCPGGPPGTGFFCAIAVKPPAPTGAVCAFLCQELTAFVCPPALACGTTPDAAGKVFCY
jgi:hypothetical protein